MSPILLIGTGPMAVAYAKVLQALGQPFIAIGRGAASAATFEEQTGVRAHTGGLQAYLQESTVEAGAKAIIATGTEALMQSLLQLTQSGVSDILVEKPAAISIAELLENETALSEWREKIFVAYNRRQYAAVHEAKKLIAEDGGLSSIHFEFTEWSHVIDPLQKAPGVKENWFLANSTHVVDLAFHLAGNPTDWNAFASGELAWHKPVQFAGAGLTDKDVLFTYHANWQAPGRWGVELLTKKRRIYLRPMEKLSVQQLGSVAVTEHEFDDSLDVNFKPGLFLQTKSFLNGGHDLLNLGEHMKHCQTIYSRMLGA